jgi:hypothetical protein
LRSLVGVATLISKLFIGEQSQNQTNDIEKLMRVEGVEEISRS